MPWVLTKSRRAVLSMVWKKSWIGWQAYKNIKRKYFYIHWALLGADWLKVDLNGYIFMFTPCPEIAVSSMKAECWRIDAFELWCWRRLLRVPQGSNQSIVKQISPEYSLEGLMLKLKLQYFGYLMRRTDSLEKTLMLGKIGGRRRRGWRGWDGWMTSPTQWTWVWVNSVSWWWTGRPGVLQSMGSQRSRHDWVTELNWTISLLFCFLPKYPLASQVAQW